MCGAFLFTFKYLWFKRLNISKIFCRDLALNLRQILGDWFRVIQIMKMGVRGTDIQMESTWNWIGNYFYDRRNW